MLFYDDCIMPKKKSKSNLHIETFSVLLQKLNQKVVVKI